MADSIAGPFSNGSAFTALTVEHLDYAYDELPALKNVNLHLGEGEAVALMGRNGSGKTTLLKCIVGLLPDHNGAIAVNSSFDPQSVCGRHLPRGGLLASKPG
ncbi:MAG: ATP-binding cassette domain-containing protein [Chloroflexota bacterium]